jgi:selenocysteine lyase/cysteine desulfurase
VTLSLARHFSLARTAAPGRINLAAHSHYDWPDVTRAAHIEAFDDALRLGGDKWAKVFGEVIPACQAHVARHLGLRDPATIAFAPNTHDFVRRLLSCLPAGRPPRVLTTGGEFHSFARQVARLEEDGLVAVERVPAEPFASFSARFADAAHRGGHDLVFVSQVFFSSGATAGDLAALASAIPGPETFLVVDGYHGFLAVPTDLSGLADRAFYMSGGYKYAMGGEGVCFMHCPPGYGPRPRDTGWFAEFGALSAPRGKTVGYAEDGRRFLGATFDPAGLYRQRAVYDWLAGEGIDAAAIHAHARALMLRFLERVEPLGLAGLSRETLVTPLAPGAHGNFLAFDTEHAGGIEAAAAARGVHCDHRGRRLRFGFGLATAAEEVDEAVERLAAALAQAGCAPS